MNCDYVPTLTGHVPFAATTHDYTDRYWGHDYVIASVIDSGQTLNMMGWGRGLNANDFLLIRNGADTTRYQIKTINYYTDPTDMWRATCIFAPRPEPRHETRS